jgi:hypothetical protein
MKPLPNNPDETALTARLAEDRQKFEALPGDAPGKKADYYDAGSRLAFGLAGLSYVLDQPVADVKLFATHATRYAQRAVACDGLLDPPTFQRYLGLAVWTNDANFRGRLSNFDRAQFTNPDGEPHDDVVYKATEAMAALARRRPEMAAEHAAAGLKRITRGLVATAVVNRAAPVLRIAEAIGKGDLYGLRGAVSERSTQYLKAASADAGRNDPEMLIDLVGLALVRMAAADYGLSVDPKSLFIPVAGLI